MPLQRRHAFPLHRTIRHVDIPILIIRVLCSIDSLGGIRDFFPDADGRIKACGRERPSARAPRDTSDRAFVSCWDFCEELEDGFCEGFGGAAVCEVVRV
jgi:hypothetical protein